MAKGYRLGVRLLPNQRQGGLVDADQARVDQLDSTALGIDQGTSCVDAPVAFVRVDGEVVNRMLDAEAAVRLVSLDRLEGGAFGT